MSRIPRSSMLFLSSIVMSCFVCHALCVTGSDPSASAVLNARDCYCRGLGRVLVLIIHNRHKKCMFGGPCFGGNRRRLSCRNFGALSQERRCLITRMRRSSPKRSAAAASADTGIDGLAALDLILKRIVLDSSSVEVGALVSPSRPSVREVNEVLTAASQGSSALRRLPAPQCCAALRALCADVDPQLFPKKIAAKVNKAVRSNRSNPRVTVTDMLNPVAGTKTAGTPQGKYSARAADLVTNLLAILAAVGLADGSQSPLAVAKEWAPALGLETTTMQLLLIRSKASAKRSLIDRYTRTTGQAMGAATGLLRRLQSLCHGCLVFHGAL